MLLARHAKMIGSAGEKCKAARPQKPGEGPAYSVRPIDSAAGLA